MATLDISDDQKLMALRSSQSGFASNITNCLIQAGYENPFTVDLDTLGTVESLDPSLAAHLAINITNYKTVSALIAGLE
jgi:hypothetical protein